MRRQCFRVAVCLRRRDVPERQVLRWCWVCGKDFRGHSWMVRPYAAENFLAADAARQGARQNQDGPNQDAVLTFPDAVHRFLPSFVADEALFQRTDYFPGAELADAVCQRDYFPGVELADEASWEAAAAEHCPLSVKLGQLILPK